MKKVILSILLLLLFIPINTFALNEVNIYFFYGNTCPHCKNEEVFLKDLEKHYENVKIYRYETYQNQENKKIKQEVMKIVNIDRNAVPLTVIGDKAILGYSSVSKKAFEDLIIKYSNEDYKNEVGEYLKIGYKKNLNYSLKERLIKDEEKIESPILKEEVKETKSNSKNIITLLILAAVIILIIIIRKSLI